MYERSPMTALSQAVVGAGAVLIVVLVPARDLGPVAWGPALIGLWLCVASLINYFDLRLARPFSSPASAPSAPRRSLIPLRFSGPTGRFVLRPRGDGRKVEVVAGPAVVAEVSATDLRDEIVLHTETVPEEELADLGSAIGQAIEMAAAADEETPDC